MKSLKSERIQKILARAGVASRRQADELVREGQVRINGKIAIPGSQADPERDSIRVGGKLLPKKNLGPPLYYLFYKPPRVISTLTRDGERNRKTLGHFLKSERGLHPVGKLDFHSEGIMILTNDGSLTDRTQRDHSILCQYEVKVKGHPEARQLARLKRGMRLGDQLLRPESVEVIRRFPSKALIRVCFRSLQSLPIRTFFQKKGFLVEKIRRTHVGQLHGKLLEPGKMKVLRRSQINALFQSSAAS